MPTVTIVLKDNNPHKENPTVVIPDGAPVDKATRWCYGNALVMYEVPEENILYVKHEL